MELPVESVTLKLRIALNVDQQPLVFRPSQLFRLCNYRLYNNNDNKSIQNCVGCRITSSNPVCVIMSVGAWKSWDKVFSFSVIAFLLPDVNAVVIFFACWFSMYYRGKHRSRLHDLNPQHTSNFAQLTQVLLRLNQSLPLHFIRTPHFIFLKVVVIIK